MLSSMKTIYIDMKSTSSADLTQYISLAQHVIGNIIQYCTSFVKEIDRTFPDLPVLDYFTNPETFPQPGANEITYAAQRLRGLARKDSLRPFGMGTQTEIFWSVKSFLEKAARNGLEGEFIGFMVLALGEGNEGLGDHVAFLRTFVVQGIFCEFLQIAGDTPDIGNPIWVYLVPCLAAIREVYAFVWDSIVREDVDGVEMLLDDLLEITLAMQRISEGVTSRVRREEGGLYSVVCARIFDFIILVDHIVFYLKQEPRHHGTSHIFI
jgi:hypothetical protein